MLCRDLVGRYFFSPCHGDSLGTAFRYFNDKASAPFVKLKTHKINLFGVKPTEVRKCPGETSLSKLTKGLAPPHPSERFKTRNQNIEWFKLRSLAIQARQATPAEDRKPQVGHEEQSMSLIQQYEVG